MKKQIILILTFLLAGIVIAFFFFALYHQEQKAKSKKPTIVCTTMLLKDVIDNLIPHETLDSFVLMGPGVDPHTYRARPSDITALLSAELIIYNGLHLEGKMGELLYDLRSKKRVICATDTLPRTDLISSGYEDIYDPHVWHDPFLWSLVVTYLAEQLALIFPESKTIIMNNYKEYLNKIDEAKQKLEQWISVIPQKNRILITAHDAFQYFGKRYQFQVLGLQGLSTESEIGMREMLDLADIIVKKKVQTIFPESCISARNMKALQELVERKGAQVSLGNELFSDALSEEGGVASDYARMLLYNTKQITGAIFQKGVVV